MLRYGQRGAYRDLPVVVAELEPEKVAARKPSERESAKPAPPVGTLGLAVTDLTDAQKRDLKVKNGVKVESAEGIAARAGVKEGDVIVSVDNVEVTNVKQFDATVAKLDKAKSITLLVRQGEIAKFLILKPR